MLDKFGKGRSASAHVIVLGNEKGGSGKSTVAWHVAVGLLKAGQRVATIDLDPRQQSFTRYISNRRAWAAQTGLDLEVPVHFCIEQGRAMQIADNEELECQRLIDAVNALDRNVDFILIDTPGTDSYLSRLAHSTADTLITPMNDSLLDFDVLGSVDPTTYAVTAVAHYAAMVRQVRRRRRQLDGSNIDWIVMRNRSSGLSSRNTQVLSGCLRQLSLELGFRPIDGFVERSIYREFFPRGMSALDDTDPTGLKMRPSPGQTAAREEVKRLLSQLKLPLNGRACRRAAGRAEWFGQVGNPLQSDELFTA
jgi:chromosome partitioning protein